LIAGSNPFSDSSASFLEAADGEVDQLCRGLICWEATACLGSFSGHPVQALNRVCGVDDFAHGWRKSKDRKRRARLVDYADF
jgi:hypothetical protein